MTSWCGQASVQRPGVCTTRNVKVSVGPGQAGHHCDAHSSPEGSDGAGLHWPTYAEGSLMLHG